MSSCSSPPFSIYVRLCRSVRGDCVGEPRRAGADNTDLALLRSVDESLANEGVKECDVHVIVMRLNLVHAAHVLCSINRSDEVPPCGCSGRCLAITIFIIAYK